MVQLAQLEVDDETGEALARAARHRGQSVDDVLRSLLGMAEQRSAEERVEGDRFDAVWKRILDLAGTDFTTRNGQRFTYAVDGSYIAPSTSEVRIPVSQFRKAYAMGPVKGPSSLRGIFAPSVVWALLNDVRVREPASQLSAPLSTVKAGTGPEGATIVSHTWPDDSGLDVAAATLDVFLATAATTVATGDQATGEPSSTVTDINLESAGPATELAPVTAAAAPPQVPEQENRSFFKRIFGSR